MIAGRSAAVLIGALIVQLRGIYFAMVTIAFGQVFYFIAFRWNAVTGGDDGLTGWQPHADRFRFRQLDILRSDKTFYYFVLFCFAVARRRHGVAAALAVRPHLVAIRENERRARFLGIPVDRHIWISWLISCAFVSLAGTLYALLNNFADPHDLRWDQSGDFVIMAVLGGMRCFWGPLIGAAIFVVLQDYVSSHDRELDVVHRPVLRAGGAVLSARRARHAAAEGGVMSLLRVEHVSQPFGSLVAVNDVSL